MLGTHFKLEQAREGVEDVVKGRRKKLKEKRRAGWGERSMEKKRVNGEKTQAMFMRTCTRA